MMLLSIIMLIWGDVVIGDNINMRMMLMLVTSLRWDDVDVENDIEMMLMLIMTLSWDVVDVENAIVLRANQCG